MKAVVIAIVAMCGLSACATNRLSDAERLDIYKAHAGEPEKISSLNWHIVLLFQAGKKILLAELIFMVGLWVS